MQVHNNMRVQQPVADAITNADLCTVHMSLHPKFIANMDCKRAPPLWLSEQ